VSVPSPIVAWPSATADADPDDDPPEMRPGACALGGVPKCAFVPARL
jgi:hypothetical protein